MKSTLLSIVCCLLAINSFAAWHKAELYYNNGSVSVTDIKLPEETFTGMFKRAIAIKDGENESYTALKEISKVVMSNGITFIKYENKGYPVLLEQVTHYDSVNILILPKVFSPEYVVNDHYIYRINGNATFEDQPVGQIGHGNRTPDDLTGPNAVNYAVINEFTVSPVGLYYSSIIRNGKLYTPASNDYVYLMKGNQIERLQSVRTYSILNEFMGDDANVNVYIKRGLSSFIELNTVVALYNAKLNLK